MAGRCVFAAIAGAFRHLLISLRPSYTWTTVLVLPFRLRNFHYIWVGSHFGSHFGSLAILPLPSALSRPPPPQPTADHYQPGPSAPAKARGIQIYSLPALLCTRSSDRHHSRFDLPLASSTTATGTRPRSLVLHVRLAYVHPHDRTP